jgi:hypothetical protein
VAGCGQVGDNAKDAALGDVQGGGDVAKAYSGVVADADEDSGVVGEKTPFSHGLVPIPELIC